MLTTPKSTPHNSGMSPEQVFSLATDFHRQQRWPEAEELYRSLLPTLPDDANLLANLATTLYEQKRIDEAAPYYQRCIVSEPNHLNALRGLGTLCDLILAMNGLYGENAQAILRPVNLVSIQYCCNACFGIGLNNKLNPPGSIAVLNPLDGVNQF